MSNQKQGSRPGAMGGPMSAMVPGAKAKDFKGTMKKLLQHLKPYRVPMILVVIFAIGSAAFTIVGPKILGNATTEIFEGLVSKVSGTGNGIDFTNISKTLTMLATLYVISAIFSFVQTFVTSDISQKVSYNLRKEISLFLKTLI